MPTAARWPDILGNVPEFVFTPRAQHSIMRSRLDNTRNFNTRVLLRLHTFPWQKQIISNRTHVWHLCWFSLPCSSVYGGPTLNFKNTFESPNSNFKKVRRSDFEFQAVVEGPNLNFVNMFEGPTLNFENPSRSELKFREKNADVQMWISKHCSKVDF